MTTYNNDIYKRAMALRKEQKEKEAKEKQEDSENLNFISQDYRDFKKQTEDTPEKELIKAELQIQKSSIHKHGMTQVDISMSKINGTVPEKVLQYLGRNTNENYVIVMQSGLGTGKTEMMCSLKTNKTFSYYDIICLTHLRELKNANRHRKLFTKTFKATVKNNVFDPETLLKPDIKKDELGNYPRTLLGFDECNQHGVKTIFGTSKFYDPSQKINLYVLLEKLKRMNVDVIGLDGLFTDTDLYWWSLVFGDKVIFINNVYKDPAEEITVRVSENRQTFDYKILKTIENGIRTNIFCITKRLAKIYRDSIKRKFIDKIVLCITADSKQEAGKEEGALVDQIKECDVLIGNQAMGRGVDIQDRNMKQFAFYDATKDVGNGDFFQLIRRHRHPIGYVIDVLIESKKEWKEVDFQSIEKDMNKSWKTYEDECESDLRKRAKDDGHFDRIEVMKKLRDNSKEIIKKNVEEQLAIYQSKIDPAKTFKDMMGHYNMRLEEPANDLYAVTIKNAEGKNQYMIDANTKSALDKSIVREQFVNVELEDMAEVSKLKWNKDNGAVITATQSCTLDLADWMCLTSAISEDQYLPVLLDKYKGDPSKAKEALGKRKLPKMTFKDQRVLTPPTANGRVIPEKNNFILRFFSKLLDTDFTIDMLRDTKNYPEYFKRIPKTKMDSMTLWCAKSKKEGVMELEDEQKGWLMKDATRADCRAAFKFDPFLVIQGRKKNAAINRLFKEYGLELKRVGKNATGDVGLDIEHYGATNISDLLPRYSDVKEDGKLFDYVKGCYLEYIEKQPNSTELRKISEESTDELLNHIYAVGKYKEKFSSNNIETVILKKKEKKKKEKSNITKLSSRNKLKRENDEGTLVMVNGEMKQTPFAHAWQSVDGVATPLNIWETKSKYTTIKMEVGEGGKVKVQEGMTLPKNTGRIPEKEWNKFVDENYDLGGSTNEK